MFKKHGLKMNLDKREVVWAGKQREELDIMLEGKENMFVYMGGHIYPRTGEWMWRCDAEYRQERTHGEM